MKISLDLLPKNKKIELRRARVFREILHEEFLFFFPVLVLIVILINVFYLLTLQKDFDLLSYKFEQNQEQYQQLDKYDQKFKEINMEAALLLKIQSGHLQWTSVLKRLGTDVPDGVTVQNFANKNFNLILTGKAKTRDSLLEFKNNLEKDDCFEKINVPLSNLVVKDNIDFQLDFVIKQNCLKG